MSELAKGDSAPDFTAKLSNGEAFELKKSFPGRNLILYFYPKDFTSGCTKEACYFRDFMKEFSALDAEIIGVSRDTDESHVQFSDHFKLNFPLVSDPKNRLGDLYGVSRMGGRLGVRRTTFVLDKERTILAVIHSEANMRDHVEKALEALKAARSEGARSKELRE